MSNTLMFLTLVQLRIAINYDKASEILLKLEAVCKNIKDFVSLIVLQAKNNVLESNCSSLINPDKYVCTCILQLIVLCMYKKYIKVNFYSSQNFDKKQCPKSKQKCLKIENCLSKTG
jgi:hypothetical protein